MDSSVKKVVVLVEKSMTLQCQGRQSAETMLSGKAGLHACLPADLLHVKLTLSIGFPAGEVILISLQLLPLLLHASLHLLLLLLHPLKHLHIRR